MIGDSSNKLFAMATILILSGGLIACTGGPDGDAGETDESSVAETSSEHAATATASTEGGGDAAMSEGEGEHVEGGEAREDGEHSEGEGGEHGESGDGEESGVYIARGNTWNVIRRGARLVMAFDPESGAFEGTVENNTESTLCAVRVEVHLSTGTELGPTERTEVRAGQSIDVTLSAEGEAFDTWTAHSEASRCSG